MKRFTLVLASAVCLTSFFTAAASAQSLASRIGAVRDGVVRFSYTARPNVCGNGNSIQTGDDHTITNDDHNIRYNDSESRCPCEYGPVRVSATVSQGNVTRIRVAVGSRYRDSDSHTTDFGQVGARDAAAYLLDLAKNSRGNAGSEAIFAITLADSVTPWPDLLRIARSSEVRSDTRKQSVFWLGQAAGDAATKDLADLAEDDSQDREVRESAVFALSQLDSDQGVPALIHIARSNRDPKLRRTALFWLGQSDDPRALDLFEEILAHN
ncbi:MAG: HEAT repeat domain-containing protein [Gemmatimonadota bacterium]